MSRLQQDRWRGRPWAVPLVLSAALAAAASPTVLAGEAAQTVETSAATDATNAADSAAQSSISAVEEDRRLAQRIGRRLAWDAKLAPYDLEVQVNNGIVNLSGSVSTMAESHRARRIADETAGVGGVVNALYIDPALAPFDEGHAPAPPDDQTLEERLQVALAHDADLADETIQVEVDDGIVRLDGTIGDAAFEMRAKRVAKSLYGVERVKSNLEVSAP